MQTDAMERSLLTPNPHATLWVGRGSGRHPSPAREFQAFSTMTKPHIGSGSPRRYQRLLADAEQRVFRVLPAFETDDLDRAYDVAEGARS